MIIIHVRNRFDECFSRTPWHICIRWFLTAIGLHVFIIMQSLSMTVRSVFRLNCTSCCFQMVIQDGSFLTVVVLRRRTEKCIFL